MFRDGNEHTATEIANTTGISRQTTMKAIRFFCNRGLLISCGKGDSTDIGGKKPEFFTFQSNTRMLCVTVWPNVLCLTLFDLAQHELDHIERSKQPEEPLDDILASVNTLAREVLSRNGVTDENLYGIAISTSGIVDYTNGIIRYNLRVPQWGQQFPLAAHLNDIFGESVNVYVESHGKAVGRSVLLHDGNAKRKRILTLFADNGLSSCMLEYGHVLNGRDSLIGELGQIAVKSEQGYRRLESFLSDDWIQACFQNDIGASASSLNTLQRSITLADLLAAADAGDGWAIGVTHQLAERMALIIYNARYFFNPDIVVFHGALAQANRVFDQELRACLERIHPAGYGDTQIKYDGRAPQKLAAMGLYTALSNFFFRSNMLYAGNDE